MNPASPPYVNLNGRLLTAARARVSVLDHGLLYGDGLFETLRVYDGRFFRLEAHLRRLAESAVRLDLPLPWSPEELALAIRDTVRANEIRDGAVRLTVTRGEGAPVPDPAACPRPTFFVTTRIAPRLGDEDWERGASVCAAGRHPKWIVPGVKSLCYLPFQHARAAARRDGYDDALLVDGDQVVEASLSNVFAVIDGALRTPDLHSGCLPGITRRAVLEVAKAARIPVEEGVLTTAELESAEEVFLTNSSIEILPVRCVGDTSIGGGRPGPITRRLHEKLRRLIEREFRV
ncbi:MAG: aminotransferase class IV [Armatimonadota bacterium]